MDRTGFIECRNLVKSFGKKIVLQGLSLRIVRGETMVILGGSGSGKTVLLKHMNGLMIPDSGEVVVDGVEISRKEEDDLKEIRKRVAMVFQGSALFDSLTIEENIAYPLVEHTGWPSEKVRERVYDLLALVGLEGTERLYPAEMSGGMKKRASLARALSLNPEALLYDEPTTGLDPVMTQRINQTICDLQKRLGVTSVVVTHDLDSAFGVGDRLAFLHQGRIELVGTREDLQRSSNPVVKEFLSAASGDFCQ